MRFFARLRLLSACVILGVTAACSTVPADPRPADRPAAAAPALAAPAQVAASPLAAGTPNTAGAPLPALAAPIQPIREKSAPPLLDLTVPPDDLWQRIRNGFGMPDLHHPLVADRQSWYLNRPDMLRRIFERSGRYLYHIVGELERRGMPTELALLPMVESAYNPLAHSPARAMGIWQFIPSTGKNYKLDQNWWVDERRDVIASTDAALTYLQTIYEMHGDWHLALASYNWGEHAVGRAIAKNQAKGLPTDYATLTMPSETRYYVPKLQALKNIIAHPDFFGFHLAPIPNQPYFETVMKPERIDVAVAARLAEMPVEEFVSLNPAYHRPVINSDQAGPLVLPVGKVDTFLSNLERYAAEDRPLSNWETYLMKRGDTLAKVATRYKLSVERLQQINGITRRVKVGPGFNLLVPRPGSQANPDLMARALPKEPSVTPPAAKGRPAGKRPAAKSAAKPGTKGAAKPAAKGQPKAPSKAAAKRTNKPQVRKKSAG
jgi:membrane-bound lytic murein transglycosylase D